MLLSDLTVVNEPNVDPGRKLMEISTREDLLGYHDHVICLTEDGYLWINLLNTGKYFRIGTEKIEAFRKEVTEHHQGYYYVYDTPTGDDLDGLVKE